MSGNVLSAQSRAGDYHKSAIVNGYPSWINANNDAIWFVDEIKSWVVGNIKDRGMYVCGMKDTAKNISKCPYDVDSTAWKFWNENC